MGKAGHRLVQRKRRLAQNGVHGHRPRGSGESFLAGGHFVEQNAEGKKIGAYVERFTAGLLRGHIGQGADGRAGMRERTAHRHRGIVCTGQIRSREFGETEVENLHLAALGDENVCRLDVAVHDALGMRRLQCVRDLQSPVQQSGQGNGLVADSLAQGLPFEQLHGDEGTPLIFVDLVDGADVGMIEGRGGAGLAFKSLQCSRLDGGTFRKELQSDQTAQTNVLGFIHHAHAALTQLSLDAVMRDSLVHCGARP